MNKVINGILITDKFTKEDIEYSVRRPGEIFNQEYGFSQESGRPVAQRIRDFGANCNPEKEFMLVAKQNDSFVGTVTFMGEDNHIGRLRYVFVDPHIRGCGVGSALIETARSMAKNMGYNHLYLSTFDVLTSARRMYSRLGFVKTGQEPADYVMPGLIEEIWEKDI